MDAAQDRRQDVVDLERRVDRRENLLQDEQLVIELCVLVAFGFELGDAPAQLGDLVCLSQGADDVLRYPVSFPVPVGPLGSAQF